MWRIFPTSRACNSIFVTNDVVAVGYIIAGTNPNAGPTYT